LLVYLWEYYGEQSSVRWNELNPYVLSAPAITLRMHRLLSKKRGVPYYYKLTTYLVASSEFQRQLVLIWEEPTFWSWPSKTQGEVSSDFRRKGSASDRRATLMAMDMMIWRLEHHTRMWE